MAPVNFYNRVPSDTQIAIDLSNDELVVFNHLRSGARSLAGRVETLVDFGFNTHNENTVRPWNGADYYVMVRCNFDYLAKREKLRTIAARWIEAVCPNQVGYI